MVHCEIRLLEKFLHISKDLHKLQLDTMNMHDTDRTNKTFQLFEFHFLKSHQP